jgi:plasmid maintenance system antidote protein VapI
MAPPPQRPEGKLIERILEREGRSKNSAAKEVGISSTHLRNIIRGYQQVSEDVYGAVRATDATLARIALVLGITPEKLESADRRDAAGKLRAFLEESPGTAAAPREAGSDQAPPAWDLAWDEVIAEIPAIRRAIRELDRSLERIERRAEAGARASGHPDPAGRAATEH